MADDYGDSSGPGIARAAAGSIQKSFNDRAGGMFDGANAQNVQNSAMPMSKANDVFNQQMKSSK